MIIGQVNANHQICYVIYKQVLPCNSIVWIVTASENRTDSFPGRVISSYKLYSHEYRLIYISKQFKKYKSDYSYGKSSDTKWWGKITSWSITIQISDSGIGHNSIVKYKYVTMILAISIMNFFTVVHFT